MSTSSRKQTSKFSVLAGERVWFGSFLMLGVLLGLVGPLLIAWHYHIDVEPQLIGLHFLALNAGYVIASAIAESMLRRVSALNLALPACVVAFSGLLGLVFVAPPLAVGWRLTLLGAIGLGAGGLGTSLVYAAEFVVFRSPAIAVKSVGTLFSCGCLLSTVVIGGSYFLGLPQIATALLAVIPVVFFILLAKTKFPAARPGFARVSRASTREAFQDNGRIASVLLSILLFFQFGSEWAIAGWLPLFLIHRLGSNPVLAIGVLAIYFLALTLGRLAAQSLLPRMGPGKLLMTGISVSMCGLFLLTFTQSLGGATAASVVTGAGFAPIYPLVAERMRGRFLFQPKLYNGVISIAITGAMCAPWALGFVVQWLGMDYIMLLPAIGTLIVLLVSLLLMLEAHLVIEPAAGGLEALLTGKKS